MGKIKSSRSFLNFCSTGSKCSHWVGKRGYCLTNNEWILVVLCSGNLFKVRKLRGFKKSGRGKGFVRRIAQFESAVTILLVKTQITRSVVTFKWSFKGRSVGDRKCEICNRDWMLIEHRKQAGGRVSAGVFWAVGVLRSEGMLRGSCHSCSHSPFSFRSSPSPLSSQLSFFRPIITPSFSPTFALLHYHPTPLPLLHHRSRLQIASDQRTQPITDISSVAKILVEGALWLGIGQTQGDVIIHYPPMLELD